MEKDEVRNLLLDILKENDTLFSDVTIDGRLGTIIIRLLHGESFALTIEPYVDREQFIRQWARENPVSLSMEFMMIYLIEAEIIDQETAREYMKEIAMRADELQEKYSDQWF